VPVGVGSSHLFGALGTLRTELAPTSIPLALAEMTAAGLAFGY
jgi:hypothetical protein